MPDAFQPLTSAEARKAVRWFQRRMRITDWRVKPVVADEPPSWMAADADHPEIKKGLCARSVHHKTATVWVSNSRCEGDGSCPLETLFHEGMHVVAADSGIENDMSPHIEFVWNRLGAVLAIAYRAETSNA